MTTLLVANDGGHITQIHRLRRRLGLGDDVLFVTVRTPQTESLLAGENVHWVPPSPTRSVGGLLSNVVRAPQLFKRHQIDHVVSTGAALALAYLPQARLRGIKTYYIESATRTEGPSLSGRLLAQVPGIVCLNQNDAWAGGAWSYLESPWDSFQAVSVPPPTELRRAVVAVGTQDRYPFARAVERLASILPKDCEVLWQIGSVDGAPLGIDGRRSVPSSELQDAMSQADVVISHAGTGAALSAFAVGKFPILLPRRAEFSEHVDDHQLQIAGEFDKRGLALVREADQVSLDDLVLAASRRIEPVDLPTLTLPGW